jgi:hypothetical protein
VSRLFTCSSLTLLTHAVGEFWIDTGLDFAFKVFHHLYYSSVFVQGGQWKAYTQAGELYLIAWPVGLVDGPSLRRYTSTAWYLVATSTYS